MNLTLPLTISSNLPLAKTIFNYFSLTIVVLGWPGNILLFVTFSGKSLRKLSVSAYFRAMAMANFFVCTTWLQIFLDNQYDFKWHNISWFTCKIGNYVCYSIASLASWLFVAAILDHFVVIARPTRLMFIQKPNIPWIIVLVLLFYNLIFYSFIFFDTSFDQIIDNRTNTSTQVCEWPNSRLSYSMLDLINSVILPFVIMLVATLATLFAVYNSRKRMGKFETSSLHRVRESVTNNRQQTTRSRDIKFAINMTILNLVFIILNAPDSILNALENYNMLNMDSDVYSFVYEIFMFLFYMLCSISFYLQLVVNVLVRKTFFKILKRLWGKLN